MSSNKFTTIRITKELKDELKTLGKMGESFNEVIERIIKEKKEGEKDES